MDMADVPNWHERFTAAVFTATATIRLRGDLEIFTVEYLRGEVDILRRQGLYTITLDLHELASIDTTAAHYLQALQAELETDGGTLTLTNPHEPVSTTLRQHHLLHRAI